VAMEHYLGTNIVVIDMCTDFHIFKVKAPIILLVTMGFSPCRDGRYVTVLVLDAEVVRFLVLIFGMLEVLLCGNFIFQAKAVCIALLELGLL